MRTIAAGTRKHVSEIKESSFIDHWEEVSEDNMPPNTPNVFILLYNSSTENYTPSSGVAFNYALKQMKDKEFRRKIKKARKDAPETKVLIYWATHWMFLYPPEEE